MDSTGEWILDSGFTFHMYHNRSWFYTFEKVNEGYVLVGNSSTCPVVKYGSVRICIFDKVIQTIGMLDIFLTSKETSNLLVPSINKDMYLLVRVELSGYSKMVLTN